MKYKVTLELLVDSKDFITPNEISATEAAAYIKHCMDSCIDFPKVLTLYVIELRSIKGDSI